MDTAGLKALLLGIIGQNSAPDSMAWLIVQGDINNTAAFNAAFAMMPRKTGKAPVFISDEQKAQLNKLRPGFSINNWTTDRLGRVWLLMQAGTTGNDNYFRVIENLFSAAEMNELVALYSALPVLSHPGLWVKRCAEGIRSNIGPVLEAIMYYNPYPAENLEQAAWNQMVMKAIFTEKELHLITGLKERANPELTRILIDYAKERWAAGRGVDPTLWELAGEFVDEAQINNMKQGHWENSSVV
ncbi:MAG: EboA domain-containing protein [Mucilaginibacter sp.]